jgi:nucleoside-diphosphate kinase
MMEKTLVVLKPDAVQRGIIGEIVSRFEKAGLKIIGSKMVFPDDDHYYKHYEEIGKVATRRGQQVYDNNLAFMRSGPVVAIALEGIDCVAIVRKMVGETEPKSSAPGTIRGDYAHMSYKFADEAEVGIPNIIHASGSLEDAEQELYHWFNDDELFEYETVHERYTRASAFTHNKKAKA